MHPLLLARVEVDWCARCRAVWFDRGELAAAVGLRGAPVITRDQPACACPGCAQGGARKGRTGLLWFSRVAGAELLACVDCAGCLVTERALQQRAAAAPLQAVATFRCAGCGDRYPVSDAHEVADALVCSRCRPPPTEPAPRSALDELLARLVALLAGDGRSLRARGAPR